MYTQRQLIILLGLAVVLSVSLTYGALILLRPLPPTPPSVPPTAATHVPLLPTAPFPPQTPVRVSPTPAPPGTPPTPSPRPTLEAHDLGNGCTRLHLMLEPSMFGMIQGYRFWSVNAHITVDDGTVLADWSTYPHNGYVASTEELTMYGGKDKEIVYCQP